MHTCALHASLVQDLIDQKGAVLVLERQNERADLDQEAVELSLHKHNAASMNLTKGLQ